MTQISKHDEYVALTERFAAYVDTEQKIVGVYSTTEDMIRANKSKALKKLRNVYSYHIQMVIK